MTTSPGGTLERTTTPLELKLSKDRKMLSIEWADGGVSRLAAELLRRNSRAASAVRAKIDGQEPVPAEVAIAGLDLIGSYAVRISFSDGHDRGIYPWAFFRDITERI